MFSSKSFVLCFDFDIRSADDNASGIDRMNTRAVFDKELKHGQTE